MLLLHAMQAEDGQVFYAGHDPYVTPPSTAVCNVAQASYCAEPFGKPPACLAARNEALLAVSARPPVGSVQKPSQQSQQMNTEIGDLGMLHAPVGTFSRVEDQ